MITFEEAKNKILKYLNILNKVSEGYSLILMDEATREEEFGWIFFYNSKEYLKDGNFSFALAGNSPILIDKNNGNSYLTGTSYPIEHYIEEFRKDKNNLNQINLEDPETW